MPLRQTPKGFFLHIRATPKASNNQIVGFVANGAGQNFLAVKVTKPADKGAANHAVIETLAKNMDIAKSSFRLISGETSREKVLEIVANIEIVKSFLKLLEQS